MEKIFLAHNVKTWLQLYVDLKERLQGMHEKKILLLTGNQIIMIELFGIKKHLITFPITL